MDASIFFVHLPVVRALILLEIVSKYGNVGEESCRMPCALLCMAQSWFLILDFWLYRWNICQHDTCSGCCLNTNMTFEVSPSPTLYTMRMLYANTYLLTRHQKFVSQIIFTTSHWKNRWLNSPYLPGMRGQETILNTQFFINKKERVATDKVDGSDSWLCP